MSRVGAVAPHGNAPCPGLVDEVLGDARAREGDDADRHHLEHRVVALEGSGLLVAGPVGLEAALLDAAIVGPFVGDQPGAARRASVQPVTEGRPVGTDVCITCRSWWSRDL